MPEVPEMMTAYFVGPYDSNVIFCEPGALMGSWGGLWPQTHGAGALQLMTLHCSLFEAKSAIQSNTTLAEMALGNLGSWVTGVEPGLSGILLRSLKMLLCGRETRPADQLCV